MAEPSEIQESCDVCGEALSKVEPFEVRGVPFLRLACPPGCTEVEVPATAIV